MLGRLSLSARMSSALLHYNCPYIQRVGAREELMMGAHGRTLSNHLVAFTLCRVHAVGGEGGSDCFDALIAGVREEFERGGFDSSASDPDTVASLLPAQLGSDARPARGGEGGRHAPALLLRSERVPPCSRHLLPPSC